jgi:hypothetical protein
MDGAREVYYYCRNSWIQISDCSCSDVDTITFVRALRCLYRPRPPSRMYHRWRKALLQHGAIFGLSIGRATNYLHAAVFLIKDGNLPLLPSAIERVGFRSPPQTGAEFFCVAALVAARHDRCLERPYRG